MKKQFTYAFKNARVEVYLTRVEKLLKLLDQDTPDWVKAKSSKTWKEELLDFALGENFYVKLLISNGDINDALVATESQFLSQYRKAEYASDDEELGDVAKINIENSHLLGVEINPEFQDDTEYQQRCLDFAWWVMIKYRLYDPANTKSQDDLNQKEEELWKSIKN